MPGGRWTTPTTFTGDLYTTTGPDPTRAFNPALVVRTRVGAATLSFASRGEGRLAYSVNGVPGSRAIVRQPFATPEAALATSYNDLWWNPAESGWGLSINQQYRTLFAVWYSYGADGRPVWYVMSGGSWVTSDTYSGTLYRTSAAPAPFFGSLWFDASAVTRVPVGSLSLTFRSADTATMSYDVAGIRGSKTITRQSF
jgi:hypothetical protein